MLATTVELAVPTTWTFGDRDEPLANRPAVVAVIGARTLLDAGNLSKSVLDALEGIVFHNDASVSPCFTVAVRARTHQRGVVAFAQLPADSSTAERINAAAKLSQDLTEQIATFEQEHRR